jgi:hypothetical protein
MSARARRQQRPSAGLLSLALIPALATAALVGRVVMHAEPSPQAEHVIDVPAGGSLQQALNQIQPGGTIRLAPGATYTGSFVLPAKGGSSYVVITTRDAALPPPGIRIDPTYKPRLATIRSATTLSALTTAAGASYYRIVGVAFEANQNGAGDIIALGSASQTTLSQVPHHIELDRVLITGDPDLGQKRGVAVNATDVVIANSDIRDIKAVAQDSQAIAGWNTPGPITIRNNFLEAAGENILFGGADLSIPGVVPSDIIVENNVLTKNISWRTQSWTVKNLFELKNARRVTVRRNVMQYNWGGAQPGFAIVFTPRNSSGVNPWVVVEDIEFSGNIVAHSGSAFNLLGHDDTDPSGQLARIVIRNNLVFGVNGGTWGGAGVFAQLGGEPRDIRIDHNTVLHDGNIVTFYSGSYPNGSGVRVTGGPITGFVFTNNLLKHNSYGIFGTSQAYGNGSLAYYAPGAVVQRNVMASDKAVASRYPVDNQFPTVAAFLASFQNAAALDYRLAAGSPFIGVGTDGQNLGCDFTTLLTSAPPPSAPRATRLIAR